VTKLQKQTRCNIETLFHFSKVLHYLHNCTCNKDMITHRNKTSLASSHNC